MWLVSHYILKYTSVERKKNEQICTGAGKGQIVGSARQDDDRTDPQMKAVRKRRLSQWQT